ncbi:MAG: ABC transporter ATP-binding protein/permease [Lachnospiraceae bacterium]|nr:ABC transporter ATP-binding protein/permease [Lachnospiraceae bacterium]
MFDKRLMKLCPESKKYIAGNILFQWLELLLNAVMVYAVAKSIENIYKEIWRLQDLWRLILLIFVTICFRFVTTKLAVRMSYYASKTVKQKLRNLIYEKLLRLGNSYEEKASTAELVQESVEGVDQLESYFGQYVPQFFYAFLAPITLFFIFGKFGSYLAAWALLICVPLIPGAIVMVQKIAKKLLSKYWGQYAKLGSTFLENLQGMTTLKIYEADEYKNQEMNKESEHFRFVTMKVLTMQLNSIIIMDFFTYGGAAVGILLATLSFVHGSISLSSCIFMILLSAEFFLPMRRLGSYFHVAMNGMAASDRIFSFLNIPEEKEKTKSLSSISDIELRNVNFSYDGTRQVLKNIQMEIKRDSFVAIVGESGCGKSTIASLLTGQNTCEEGQILLDGDEIKDIREDSLMKHITYVSHNSFFFKGSVRENLLMANPNATEREMEEALTSANLYEFFMEAEGLDSQLLENASNLSGGQRQRLALARALLHNSTVYIFDEATSNIDVESEEVILQSILELTKKKTVIFISHRLANTVLADHIFVMEEGAIVEEGTHESLLDKNGVYRNLWETQVALEQYGREV